MPFQEWFAARMELRRMYASVKDPSQVKKISFIIITDLIIHKGVLSAWRRHCGHEAQVRHFLMSLCFSSVWFHPDYLN